MNERPYQKLEVGGIRELFEGFKIFELYSPTPIKYGPGQYLTLVFDVMGEELRRSYSIVSVPGLKEPLSIGVKRVDNGIISRVLIDRFKTGDHLYTTGAGGLFVLPHEIVRDTHLVFFAAGSGITPIYSLLRYALYFHPQTRVTLVYSNSMPGTTAFLYELQELERLFFFRLKIHWLFSNHPDLRLARLNRDTIIELYKDWQTGSEESTYYYICGPESYLRLCTYVLREIGVDEAKIRKEYFLVPERTLPLTVPEKEKRVAFIQLGKDVKAVEVIPPLSILQAAKQGGVSLPYSCENGRCGNCIARCISGTVWHSNNEVLTDEDLAKGLILTCTGHPVGGDIEISYA